NNSTSNESTETVATSSSQETQNSASDLETRMRTYIDIAIQALTASLLEENIETTQGNYPPTPTMNNLILQLNSKNQGRKVVNDSEETSYKTTNRKFPSLTYISKEKMYAIQGFYNQTAIETEQIRLWWVMNWSEGQKRIEMLPKKPNLPNKTWKAIALGMFVDLQEFVHKNLVNNVKQMNEDSTLQTLDGGILTIKKRRQNATFENILEWLLAFKAYIDAVLIIYDNQELELNTYRDHINELCIRYRFSAVMSYDEDRRIALVINCDTTLMDRDTEAEGKNFDAAATKRARDEKYALIGIEEYVQKTKTVAGFMPALHAKN
ncbi:21425_t:CDS:2, partial [Cetraspora pellucida]